MLVQCVAEVLGLEPSRIRIVASDSRITPKDNGSYSSRVTFMVGNAAIDAAKNLKTLLIAAAARKLDARPQDVECLGEYYRAARQDRGIDYESVVSAALEDSGTITVKGTFSTIAESHGGKKYRGAAIGGTMGFSYAAQVVEVTLDPDTAEVRIDNVWVAHDCGKALNPLAVEGQIEGSVWMGMGQALSEENQYIQGLPVHANLIDYRVPTIVESPDIEVETGLEEASSDAAEATSPPDLSSTEIAVADAPTPGGISPELLADPYGEEVLDVSAADFEALLSEHAGVMGELRLGT